MTIFVAAVGMCLPSSCLLLTILSTLLQVLSFTRIVLISLDTFKPGYFTLQTSKEYQNLSSSATCTTAVASVLAAVTIAHRIYTATRYKAQSRRRYHYITTILTQSCGVYSILNLTDAVVGFVYVNGDSIASPAEYAVAGYIGLFSLNAAVGYHVA